MNERKAFGKFLFLKISLSKNDQLGNLIRNTRSYNLLAIASVKLFRNLSTQVVDPFMSPELVDR